MFRASADLPTPGLAARIIKLLFWKPAVALSRSINPVATPRRPPSCL